MPKIEISKLKPNPDNPRLIKDEKYQKLIQSIKEFPQMLELRPIICNEAMIVLGGNMRLKACKEAGIKKIPYLMAKGLSAEQEREFIIKDNIGFGEWEWSMISGEWDLEKLQEWGMDLPLFDSDDLGDGFDLPEGGKEPFQQMTFNLADEQATQIKNALEEIKKTEEFKHCETFANENGNGNALYLIIMQWAEQRK